MISVAEAREALTQYSGCGKPCLVNTEDACGLTLAENVCSPIDTPPFDQSSMDGYAVAFSDIRTHTRFSVAGEIRAGSNPGTVIGPGETCRIYTGAKLPPGSDTVVMQERVLAEKQTISIIQKDLVKGENVRPRGSQTKKGELVLEAYRQITPAGVSFLSGLGITEVFVYPKPAVSIIITGGELVNGDSTPQEGKVFESTSAGLKAALKELGIHQVSVKYADDSKGEISAAVRSSLHADYILISGGVSAGDYDLVPSALEQCGFEKYFHGVKQKPGKPLLFGRLQKSLVFGLPGNPASALICFYEYAVPSLGTFSRAGYQRSVRLPLLNEFVKKSEFTMFLKGKTESGGVRILGNQESSSLRSFADADCLVELPECTGNFAEGRIVDVRMIT